MFEKPIEGSNVLNDRDVKVLLSEDQTLDAVNFLESYVASNGVLGLKDLDADAILYADLAQVEKPPELLRVYNFDPPDFGSLEEALTCGNLNNALIWLQLKTFGHVHSRYTRELGKFVWDFVLEPWTNVTISTLSVPKPYRYKLLDARTLVLKYAWMYIHRSTVTHDIHMNLDFQDMICRSFSHEESPVAGVTSANVPLSEYARRHPGRIKSVQF